MQLIKVLNYRKKTMNLIFNKNQLDKVSNAANLAEELVSNEYKLTTSQWLRHKYEIKTLNELSSDEILDIPFAQLIRYTARKESSNLISSDYDYYKICLQDHNILSALKMHLYLDFFPFLLYIITHEIIHIVRFSNFLQSFLANDNERLIEEKRVHKKTFDILSSVNISGMYQVLQFKGWKIETEDRYL